MRYFFLIILLISTIVSIIQFNSIEYYLIENGLSWTFSKLFPYLLLVLEGILFVIAARPFLKRSKPIIRILVLLILFALPFTIGFTFHPIYEGDFVSEGTVIQPAKQLSVNGDYDLIVIAIPGCPYCLQSTGRLKLLKLRNPEMKIGFAVCAEDETLLNEYKVRSSGSFEVFLTPTKDSLADLAMHRFPSFIRTSNFNAIYKWSNDQFGAGALDMLEKDFN